MVHLSDCFRINRVRISCQLVNFLINIILDLFHEVFGVDPTRPNLFSDVKGEGRVSLLVIFRF